MDILDLEFAVEVTEEQRLLNGTRYRALEGQAEYADALWTLMLSLGQRKEANLPPSEGELTLASDGGELFAGVEEGQLRVEPDDLLGTDCEVVDLSFRIEAGSGAYEQRSGSVRIQGTLTGAEGTLKAHVALE